MSLRQLPELSFPQGSPSSIQLSEKAAKMYRAIETPQAAAPDSSDTITILEVIGYDWWSGEGVTAKRIDAALRKIGPKPVTVMINSPGGNFFEGVSIYNMLRNHPAKVTAQIIGIAASAASLIAMAADEIQIAKLGFMMIHNTQSMAGGDQHVLREAADTMAVFDQVTAQMYAERTGIDVAEITAMLNNETWMAGQGAVDLGFADSVADIKTSGAAVSNSAPPLYRIEAALSVAGMPRTERRQLMKEITAVMPGADSETATPSAGLDCTSLNLALARLKLTRA